MFFEYEIYCGNQLVKFKQRIDQGAISFDPNSLPRNQKILRMSYAEDRLADQQIANASSSGPVGGDGAGDAGPSGYGGPVGGDGAGDAGPSGYGGPGTYGSAPITIVGPFISICPCCEGLKAEQHKVEVRREEQGGR